VITVRPIVTLYAAATVVTLGLWRAATDKEMGRRIAESGWSIPLFAVVCGAMVLFTMVRAPAVYFWSTITIGVIGGSVRYAAWFSRKRLGGRLLLSLSPLSNRRGSLSTILFGTRVNWYAWLGIYLMLGYAWSQIAEWKTFDPTQPVWTRVVKLIGALWILFYVDPLPPNFVEIREQGIFNKGRLLRWGNIESYEWHTDTTIWGTAHETLKIRQRRVLKAMPPVRLYVRFEMRTEVNALLSRYLSDWPSAAGQPESSTQLDPGLRR
jgi:hypothetical protein